MAYNNKVHFTESTALNVESGGEIVIEEGAYIKQPVLGTTVFTAADVVTGTTVPNSGAVILTQNATTSPRLFSVAAPVEGCRLDIIIASTASTGSPIEFNLGSGVGVVYANTTSMQYIIASTDREPAAYRSLSLIGLSTALWGVANWVPSSTGWLFAASTS